MRRQTNKFGKRTSTKYERRFLEILKKNHIRFLAKAKVDGREVDFLVGKYAIDINGHVQDPVKNEMLVTNGWIPVHYNNSEINKNLNINYLYEYN